MGCDIHVLTEKKFKTNETEKWINSDNWKKNPWCETLDEENKYKLNPIYFWRDYELFSVLANVRNDDKLNYISEPKGVPEDMDDLTKKYIDNWGEDGHSHSWFTIKELYEYWLEMPEKIKRSGVLIGKQLEKFDNDGIPPTSWCMGYMGNEKNAHREWEVEHNPLTSFMETLLKAFCEEFWIFNVSEYKSANFQNLINNYGNDYRVIFFFDN